jgi:hypothetical protein
MTTYLCAAVVLALRTWAVWDRSRLCGLVLGLAFVWVVVWVGVYITYALLGMEVDGLLAFPGTPGCGIALAPSAGQAAQKDYGGLVAYEGRE